MDRFINLSDCPEETGSSVDTSDAVNAYARDTLTLGMFMKEFDDCTREGDGLRKVRCWEYFLLIFKANNRTNYSIEAFILLCQYHFMVSPRLAMQLTWSRTVNTRGLPGKNVPCDLHMEFLNRMAKDSLRGLGSNITDEAVRRIGKCIGEIVDVVKQFDEVNQLKEPSTRHSKKAKKKDLEAVVKQLHQVSDVFCVCEGRAHKNFSHFKNNSMRSISMKELQVWMKEQLRKLLLYHC